MSSFDKCRPLAPPLYLLYPWAGFLCLHHPARSYSVRVFQKIFMEYVVYDETGYVFFFFFSLVRSIKIFNEYHVTMLNESARQFSSKHSQLVQV